MTAQPALEPVTDNDQRGPGVTGCGGVRHRFRFKRPIILGDGFERTQEIPA